MFHVLSCEATIPRGLWWLLAFAHAFQRVGLAMKRIAYFCFSLFVFGVIIGMCSHAQRAEQLPEPTAPQRAYQFSVRQNS